MWRADTVRQYFDKISGSSSSNLFNDFFTFDFETVRGIAASVGNPAMYQASDDFTTDRRVEEKSTERLHPVQPDLRDMAMPDPRRTSACATRRRTSPPAPLVPTRDRHLVWVANNEFSVQSEGADQFTTLEGDYDYVLPSLDFSIDVTDTLKLRASYGQTIGRPGWGDIQGGQTLDQLARINGGTGAQGNPGLKPLESTNIDLSVEWYYAESSYLSVGYFHKDIDNYVGIVDDHGHAVRSAASGTGRVLQRSRSPTAARPAT